MRNVYNRTVLPLIVLIMLVSCSDRQEVWNRIPQAVVNFIETYWPGTYASSVGNAENGDLLIQIAYGPGLRFSESNAWISVSGNGEVLPRQFLFDCMPQDLYRYLEETELTDEVFDVRRDARTYELKLLTQDISYTIADGNIHVTIISPE